MNKLNALLLAPRGAAGSPWIRSAGRLDFDFSGSLTTLAGGQDLPILRDKAPQLFPNSYNIGGLPRTIYQCAIRIARRQIALGTTINF